MAVGALRRRAGVCAWAPLFEVEQRLLDEISERDDSEEWDRLYSQITDALTLVAPDEPVAHFLLHVEDGKAWFRWTNEATSD